MTQARIMLLTTSILAMQIALVNAQALPSSAPKGQQQALVLSGHVVISGNPTAYLIRELPVSSFPALPDAVQNDLNKRGCAIPQTYEAHRPENVVHGNFEGRGASDWAVLCAAQGTVSLLVFFDGSTQPAAVLASAPETERLQAHDSSGVLSIPHLRSRLRKRKRALCRTRRRWTMMRLQTRSWNTRPSTICMRRAPGHW
jgi:hypothetical protein